MSIPIHASIEGCLVLIGWLMLVGSLFSPVITIYYKWSVAPWVVKV